MTISDYIENGLPTESRDFIAQNIKENPLKLRLKFAKKKDLLYAFLIDQIEARQRLKIKNPSWSENQNLLFPKKLSVEQSSSDTTAKYKAQIVSGKTLADLTGGLGIDSVHFSKSFDHVTYIEQDEMLCAITQHNTRALGIKNITVLNIDSIARLSSQPETYSCIYIDPARRDQGKKLVSLEDCMPDVVSHLELLFSRTDTILIKASPLLDLKKTVTELKFVKEIHILSIKNDCKEVLFLLEKGHELPPKIITLNFLSGEKIQSFSAYFPDPEKARINELQTYLYEPNASIMKAGVFGSLSKFYNLFKLHPNSNVYTSEEWLPGFPGRALRVISKQAPYKQSFKGEYLNIVTRNFKQKPEEIRKKLKAKDGGARFLFATTDLNNRQIFILCEKVEE